MNRVRLLPIVVLAAVALLVFKTVGLVTNGGYVLTGVETAIAADSKPARSQPAKTGDAAPGDAGGLDGPTLADPSPTISDQAPVLATGDGGESKQTAAAHSPTGGDSAQSAKGGEQAAVPAGGDAKPASGPGHGGQGKSGTSDQDSICEDVGATPAGSASGGQGSPECIKLDGGAAPQAPQLSATERALLQRLGQRRTELDTRESELDVRQSLIEAAEKRLEDSKQKLTDLEAQIASLTAQQKAAEDQQIKSLAGMYESMRPQDAAKIFETLDAAVLSQISRGMNPRKLAAVMAKMIPQRAQTLTALLASKPEQPADAKPSTDPLAELPQIAPQQANAK